MGWRADEDGTVFRVSATAAPYLPEEAFVEQADAVMASLRRLAGASPPEKKPWWKVW